MRALSSRARLAAALAAPLLVLAVASAPAALAAPSQHPRAVHPRNWPDDSSTIQFIDATGNGIGINSDGAAVGAENSSNYEVFYVNYYDDNGYFNLTDSGPNGGGGCLFYSATYNDWRLNPCGTGIGTRWSELFFSVSNNSYSGICSAYNGNDCLWWDSNGTHIGVAPENGNNGNDRWHLTNTF